MTNSIIQLTPEVLQMLYGEPTKPQDKSLATRETVGPYYATNHQAHLAIESGLTKDEFIRSLLAENERLMDVVISLKRCAPLFVHAKSITYVDGTTIYNY